MLNFFIKKNLICGKITLALKMFVSKLSFKQTTDLLLSQLMCTIKTTPTVSIRSTCYEKHAASIIMVIRIKLRIFEQVVTSELF